MQQRTVLSTQRTSSLPHRAETKAAIAPHATTTVTLQAAYGKLPLHFEANRGQSDPQVKFLAHGSGYTLFLTATEAVLALRQKPQASGRNSESEIKPQTPSPQSPAVLHMQLVGANPQAHVTGEDELPGKSNYFFGNDPAQWHTNIPTYAKVRYRDVYPGVDLVYYGNQRQLEYDFVVTPGADPHVIRLAFAGLGGAHGKEIQAQAASLHLDADGALILPMADSELRFHQPRIYQEIDGTKQPVTARYVLFPPETADSGLRTAEVGFAVAAYDPSKPLIIDPVLVYSTYLGDTDSGQAIAVDAAGNAYVTGSTSSSNFPTAAEAFQSAYTGQGDVFVAKLNPIGSALVYSTYLGGGDFEKGTGIAVDTAGNAYVTGSTQSVDFPTTTGALQRACRKDKAGLCKDTLIVKLNWAGSALEYSTYLGGSGSESGSDIAVDIAGNAYVTGTTDSSDFPITQGALQLSVGDCSPDAFSCGHAFVSKLNAMGSALVYSTYLGGGKFEFGTGIAVDTAGSAYITGQTESLDFPTTEGAFQRTCSPVASNGRCSAAFVAKLDPTGSFLVYSTYLGSGLDPDIAADIT
ncbi:MAG TPA: SBBP repeat-containing protein, partial [Candidatus Binatia bacterium]|nr:SBBP repeat-containing protein [Candidatus Binatia bacterium]